MLKIDQTALTFSPQTLTDAQSIVRSEGIPRICVRLTPASNYSGL